MFNSDTWICTEKGLERINFISTPSINKSVLLKVKLQNGMQICLNPNLQIKTIVKKTKHPQLFVWKKVNELQIGDFVTITNNRLNNNWNGEGDFDEGWLIGEIIGDGGLKNDSNHAYLAFWGKNRRYMAEIAVNIIRQKHKVRSDFAGSNVNSRDLTIVRNIFLSNLTKDFGIDKKKITYAIETASSDFYKGFLRGFFDSDGSVQGEQEKGVSLRLSQSDLSILLSVQRMLNRLGIVSTIYDNRRKGLKDEKVKLLPDGKGGYKNYQLKAQHELVISIDNLPIFSDLIGFYDVEKKAKLEKRLNNYKRKLNRERFSSKVKSIDIIEDFSYHFSVDETNEIFCNGFIISRDSRTT